MKALLVLLLIAAAVIGLLVFGPSQDSSGTASPATKTRTAPKETPSQSQQAESTKQRRTMADDVTDVMSYGVGYTQFKAKQRSERKLDDLNQRHQTELQKKLEE